MQTQKRTLDVSGLPNVVFGHRSVIWWGTIGFMTIEGTMFGIVLASYFFLRTRSSDWPPGISPPGLLWGTVNTIVFLLSVVPNAWLKKQAYKLNLQKVRMGLLAVVGIGIVNLIVRAFEFTKLNSSWDANAYSSIVWFILGIHTVHLATDWVDTGVLAALFFSDELETKRYVDVEENCDYWYFVVFSWLVLYVVLYWAPRWL